MEDWAKKVLDDSDFLQSLTDNAAGVEITAELIEQTLFECFPEYFDQLDQENYDAMVALIHVMIMEELTVH